MRPWVSAMPEAPATAADGERTRVPVVDEVELRALDAGGHGKPFGGRVERGRLGERAARGPPAMRG